MEQANVQRETQTSISNWANETFGPTKSNLSIAVRANQEMAELITSLERNDNDTSAVIEAADIIIIILMRLFDNFNVNWDTVVGAKMKINRNRKWNLTGDGHGYHVK